MQLSIPHGDRAVEGNQEKGFTLVELLVVIGIVALLISLLLPALAAARQSAQSLKCETQLRTLGQMLMSHAQDHKGYFPLAGHIVVAPSEPIDSPANCGDPTMQKYDYYYNNAGSPTILQVTALPEALSPYLGGTPAPLGDWAAVMTHMVAPGPTRDAFMCPADDYTINQPAVETAVGDSWWVKQDGTALYAWTSYGYNEEFFGWYPKAWTPLRGKISACPHPAETMLMMDIKDGPIYAHIWTNIPNSSLADVYIANGPGAAGSTIFDLVRHRGRINILYADGHVDSQPILEGGGTAPASGAAAGTAGNMPSGYLSNGQTGGVGLGGVSVARDFY